MNRLDHLKEISDQALSGLRPDDQLKARILEAAREQSTAAPAGKLIPFRSARARKAVASLCALAAAMVLVFVGLSGLNAKKDVPELKASTVAAGSHKVSSPVGLDSLLEERNSAAAELGRLGLLAAEPASISAPGMGEVHGTQACQELIALLQSGSQLQESLPPEAKTVVIQFADGHSLELPFDGDRIQLESCWSCPAFFEALRSAD